MKAAMNRQGVPSSNDLTAIARDLMVAAGVRPDLSAEILLAATQGLLLPTQPLGGWCWGAKWMRWLRVASRESLPGSPGGRAGVKATP